jgi:hypothetical protein
MAVKLVGADDATGVNTNYLYWFLTRFQAVASGNMTEFRVKSGASGNVKVALYEDDEGEPGALITAMNTGQAVTGSGWETLSFTSTPITSGAYYWLAYCKNTAGAVQRENVGQGTTRYKSADYDTFTFPNPAGTGFSNQGLFHLMAGWGELTVTAKTSSDTGSGVDVCVSLETPGAKLSSDIGSGVEGMPLPSATLTGDETGAGIEVLAARLLASLDTGTGVEVAQLVGLLKELYATELGEGCDLLTAKIEMPTKGGGMKLWT